MRLPNQIRAVACVCWVGVLGSATYFAGLSEDHGRSGVHQGRGGLDAGRSYLGAQDAQPYRLTAGPHNGESLAASAGSPGFAQYHPMPCSAVLPESRVVGSRECAPSDGSAQGARLVPPVLSTSQSVSLLKEARAGSYLRQMATDAANLCGVPVALFHALISRESSWRPHVVSHAGAVGLAQVKPSTAREISPTLDVHDPWQNLVSGACYLRRQFDRFGTWRAALHAYRLGPSAVVTRAARNYASDIIGGSAQ